MPDERQPGLDDVAYGALKGAAQIAIGLLSLPIIGLGVLLAVKGSGGRDFSERSGDGSGDVANGIGEPPMPFAASGHAEAPPRAEVEAALRKLTDATLPRSRPRKTRS